MSKNWGKINEVRTGYIIKRNRENEQITTLTEEQHEVIQWLCSVRHKIHSSWEGMFNSESADYDLWKHFDRFDMIHEEYSINHRLLSVGLSAIDFGFNLDDIESSDDYEYMEDEEKDNYEQKVEEDGRDMTAFQLWYEETYTSFCEDMEKINTAIEKYLADIDKQHGTNYCPSGWQRLY